MATVINGTAINFGFTGTNGITITGITGLLQSVDWTKNAAREMVLDAVGNPVTDVIYGDYQEVALEIVVTGTDLAAAITNSNPPSPGTFFPITTCTKLPNLVSNYWRAEPGAKISGSNTTVKRISVTLRLDAAITAAAS